MYWGELGGGLHPAISQPCSRGVDCRSLGLSRAVRGGGLWRPRCQTLDPVDGYFPARGPAAPGTNAAAVDSPLGRTPSPQSSHCCHPDEGPAWAGAGGLPSLGKGNRKHRAGWPAPRRAGPAQGRGTGLRVRKGPVDAGLVVFSDGTRGGARGPCRASRGKRGVSGQHPIIRLLSWGGVPTPGQSAGPGSG